MQYTSAILLAAAGFTTTVSAHGFVTSPQARMPGTAMEAACGQQVEVNQASDNYGNIQGELQVAASQTDYNAAECDIWLCKGYKYADNTANVQSYTAGQVVPMTVDIRAPHTGYANVSIVDTATNTMISDYLAYWSVYASTATSIPANETSFSITIPDDLGDKCATAGACVIQWYWNAPSIDQTYEACIDFTLGGSGSSTVSASSVVSTSAIPTSAVVPTSSDVPTSSVVPTSSAAAETISAASTSTEASTSIEAAVSTSAASSIEVQVPSTSAFVPSAVPTVSSTAILAPSSSVQVSSAAVFSLSSAVPVASSFSSFAIPTTFKTHTRPFQPHTFTSAVTKVPATTTAATAAASSLLGDSSDITPMPAGTTFQDVMSWITDFVANLVQTE